MVTVFKKRTKENEIPVGKKTLGALLSDNGLDGKLDEVALYNWGTK